MRIRDFLPESWWKDLDPGFLSMMGYETKESAPEPEAKDENLRTVADDITSIRNTHKAKKL